MRNQRDNNENKQHVSENANSSANAGNNQVDENGLSAADSSLQSPAEFEQDKHSDHAKDNSTVTASGIDDLQSNSDGAAGTDRAGTAERKSYGDPQLNKGLEAQAKDDEGA